MHITVSANKVADFIVAKTPQRRRAIVRQVMQSQHQDKGYAPYYSAFRTPAKEFMEGGATDDSIVQRAIKRMQTRTGTPWKDTDSRITREAFAALRQLGPTIRAADVTFHIPKSPAKAKLDYPDITVTVTPDLIVHGERNGAPLIGAARFYLAKESPYQLGKRGAEMVATMEYLWLVQTATGKRAPDPSLCMVIECIQQRITVAPDDTSHHEAAIERGCREFVHLWRQLSSEEAA